VVTNVQTLDEIVGASAGPQRFNATQLGGFAGRAAAVSGVGIGGVLAISVSRRKQEIGIRLALGANAVLCAVALVACAAPALRASRVAR